MNTDSIKDQIQFDHSSLFREETFTDRKVGQIKKLTPVTIDGQTDTQRDIIYIGQTQMMTPMGSLPLSFEIDADSLSSACENFATHAEKALEDTLEELKRYQREQASNIVVPGSDPLNATPSIQIP